MHAINLSNRVALVTGSSQGLGDTTARALHAAGASVVINYFDDSAGTNRGKADAVVASLGQRAMAIGADVRDYAAVEAMMRKAIEVFGGLDIVVNNAGIVRDRTIKKMSLDEWNTVIETNLTGVFHVCKAASEHMRDGGRIVNVASVSAAVGLFGQGNYAAAKSGVIGLTKVLSRELSRRRITVNAIAPGLVLTEMGKTVPDEVQAQWLANIPLGRFAEPREIAEPILFLCSEMADYITGQTLHVSGGWQM